MKTSRIKYIFFFSVMIFISCKSALFEKNVNIPNNVWDMNNIVKIEAEIKDISKPYDLFLNIRNGNMYPSQNLWLFVRTTSPKGKVQIDTIECILADEKGKWFGDGMGDIYDYQAPYKHQVGFAETGKYTFEIQHGMRMEQLPFIMEIGLTIDYTDTTKTNK